MEIIRIIGVGLISVIIIVILKQYKPEFAIYASILSGAVILFLVMDKLAGTINIISSIASKANINSNFLEILLKITGIAFLTEFAVSICKDAGESAIANKIDMGGKIIVIAMSIPIVSALLELIAQILP